MSESFLAVLIKGRVRITATLPAFSAGAPRQLSLYGGDDEYGVETVDVYRLTDDSLWPEKVVYVYQETVPMTTDDQALADAVEDETKLGYRRSAGAPRRRRVRRFWWRR